MKMVRYQTTTGQTAYGRLNADGGTTRLAGEILDELTNTGEPIILPRRVKGDAVDYECELAVVIGKECLNGSKADALQYVLGYTCANDVSGRDWQMNYGGSQWCRGKTFATFCPLTLLAAGTVILTGTPHGVGGARKPPVFLQPGESVTISGSKASAY